MFGEIEALFKLLILAAWTLTSGFYSSSRTNLRWLSLMIVPQAKNIKFKKAFCRILFILWVFILSLFPINDSYPIYILAKNRQLVKT
jgi:hypothetical protein